MNLLGDRKIKTRDRQDTSQGLQMASDYFGQIFFCKKKFQFAYISFNSL